VVSGVHEVVSGLGDWQQLDREEAEITRQVAALDAYSRKVRLEYEQALAKWEQAFTAAIAGGSEPPGRPPEPDLQPPLGQQLQQQRVQLVDRRADVLRANRRVILGRARERAAALLDKARELKLSQLGAIATELSEIAVALRQALADGSQFQPVVTSLDVCAAVLAGTDPLFKPNPPPGVHAQDQLDAQPRTQRDTSPSETVQQVRDLHTDVQRRLLESRNGRESSSREVVRRVTGS